MRLQSFRVDKLFGSFSYDFDIPREQKIFLLTGPNGYGKTTILTILNELAKRNLYYFYMLPFERISLDFDRGENILIEKISESDGTVSDTDDVDVEVRPERKVCFSWLNAGKTVSRLCIGRRIILDSIPRHMLFGRQGELLDDVHSKSFVRFMAENGDAFLARVAETQGAGQFLLFLRSLSVLMLPSDRLTLPPLRGKDESRLSIEEVSDRLKRLLHSHYIKYLEAVNRSNRGLFERCHGRLVA